MACNRVAGPHKLFYAPYNENNLYPSWNISYYLGATGPEGITITRETVVEQIQTDRFGASDVDGVYKGTNLNVSFILQEVNLQRCAEIMHPWQTFKDASEVHQQKLGTPGQFVCEAAGWLWIMPEANTTAFTYSPGTATSGINTRRFLGLNVGPIVESMDTRPRFVPISFKCYPYYVNSTQSWHLWEWEQNQEIS